MVPIRRWTYLSGNVVGTLRLHRRLTEMESPRPLAEVVPLRPEPPVNVPAASVVYECWPADGGAPLRWTGR